MSGRGGWGVDSSFGESCLKLRAYRDLLRFIASKERRGISVRSRDIGSELKRPSNTLMRHLEAMEEEGLLALKGEPGTIRDVALTDLGCQMAKRCGAPVLGTIPAGMRRMVTETDGRDMEGGQIYLDTWDDILPLTEDDGILVVKGDSMIDEQIRPGDRIQINLGVGLHEIEPGQICAVSIGDEHEATLKYVFPDEDGEMFTIRAANKNYEDIRVHRSDLRITGTIKALMRTF